MYVKGPTALLPFRRKSYSGFLRSEKKTSTQAEIEPTNLGSSGEYDNYWTTGVDSDHWFLVFSVMLKSFLMQFYKCLNVKCDYDEDLKDAVVT